MKETRSNYFLCAEPSTTESPLACPASAGSKWICRQTARTRNVNKINCTTATTIIIIIIIIKEIKRKRISETTIILLQPSKYGLLSFIDHRPSKLIRILSAMNFFFCPSMSFDKKKKIFFSNILLEKKVFFLHAPARQSNIIHNITNIVIRYCRVRIVVSHAPHVGWRIN